MQSSIIKKINKFGLLISLAFVLLPVGLAKAKDPTLPELMAGQTTVEIKTGVGAESTTFYGGQTGNFAVLNYDKDNPVGFNKTANGLFKTNCLLNSTCFMFGTGVDGATAWINRSVEVMSSKTSIDGVTYIETPALFTYGQIISGDAYLPDYSNFAFWSKNLALSGGNTTDPSGLGASWSLKKYALNPNAKVAWGGNEMAKYVEGILQLKAKATMVDSSNNDKYTLATSLLDLDNSSGIIGTHSDADQNSYPEGRAWLVENKSNLLAPRKDLTISNSLTYRDKGTIIVNGDLVIKSGVRIEANTSGGGKLGFIVLGNVKIEGNNDIEATIFCLGNPKDLNSVSTGEFIFSGSNINIYGSSVAREFLSAAGKNVRYFSDPDFAASMPPGFGFLNLPSSQENGNN